MAKNSALSVLKAKLLIVLFFIVSNGYSQEWKVVDSVKIINPDRFGHDKMGNIYVADSKGNLFKYSPTLDSVIVYSPSTPARISSFDPWIGLRVFIFYQDLQQFTLLNRFLRAPTNYTLPEEGAGFVIAATPSFDNKLWLIDQSTLSLLKYDYLNSQIEFVKPLDRIFTQKLQNIVVFREYQNRIYLADRNGSLYVFDNLGNFLYRHDIPKLEWMGFYKNSAYYMSDGKLRIHDLYSFDLHETIVLPHAQNTRQLAWMEEKIYYRTDTYIYFIARK